MEIRTLRPKDIPQVIHLWKENGDYHDWMDTPEALARKAEKEEGLFLVAEEDCQVVGTVMGGFDGRCGFIARLAVALSHRRKGIATSLLRELESRLKEKGAPQASLIVEEGNEPAISLYREMGYEMFDGILYMRKRIH
jgi:ribosomal protein S18 acetylase RimI-like enzyme